MNQWNLQWKLIKFYYILFLFFQNSDHSSVQVFVVNHYNQTKSKLKILCISSWQILHKFMNSMELRAIKMHGETYSLHIYVSCSLSIQLFSHFLTFILDTDFDVHIWLGANCIHDCKIVKLILICHWSWNWCPQSIKRKFNITKISPTILFQFKISFQNNKYLSL